MADLTGQNIQDTYQKVIQVDDNQVQDGTGSNLPISFDGNNVIVSGSITAHEYIVSSSVTNITIATKSGSTAFGDTLDDVHTFTGKSLRFKSDENTTQKMSVNIVHSTSSVGGATGGRLDFTTGDYSLLNGGPNHSVRIRTNAIDEYNHPIPDRSYGMDINGNLYVDNISNTGGNIIAKGTISGSGLLTSFVSASSHITSQGNISASGLISTPYQISAGGQIHGGLLKTDGYLVGDTSQPTELFVAGKVTVATTISANGNISSSGNVYAVDYFDDGTNINTLYDLTPTGTYSSSLQTLTNITASGNISSSGQISGLSLKSIEQTSVGSAIYIGVNEHRIHQDPNNASGLNISEPLSVDGNITASGNISSSGTVTAEHFHSSDDIVADGFVQTPRINGYGGSLYIANHTHIVGHVTASGNISSSGDLFGTNLTVAAVTNTDRLIVDQIDAKNEVGLRIMNDVTASGNISASGIVYAARIYPDGPDSPYLDSGTGTPAGPNIGSSTGFYATTDITASGNISASGDLLCNNLDIDGNIKLDNGAIIYSEYTNRGRIDLYSSNTNESLQVRLQGDGTKLDIKRNSGIDITGNITASGNISASGEVYASRHYVDNYIALDTTGTTGTLYAHSGLTDIHIGKNDGVIKNIKASGHITASGDISSSGYITANRFYGYDNTTVGAAYISKAQIGTGLGTNGSWTVGSHITASGNISSSGYIYSSNEEAYIWTFQLDMPSTNWFGPNRQGPSYYFWNKDYGNDTAVQTIDWSAGSNERFLNSGWRVPYKMEITKIHFYGHNAQNASSPYTLSTTASLLVGSPQEMAPGASALSLTTIATTISNIGASRYAGHYAETTVSHIVSESQFIYPRLKATNSNQDINGTYTVYYRRVK